MNQKKLFDSFLEDASDNSVPDVIAPDLQDELPESRLRAGFHAAVDRFGSPYSDRAEAAEVALDAAASVIAGASWAKWLDTPGHQLGKQGYRAEALVLLTTVAEAGTDAAAVRDWYGSLSEVWDESGYDRSGFIADTLQRVDELRDVARSRPAGTLFSLTED